MSSPLRLLLVDDEAPARTRLRDLLNDIANELATEVIAEADNGNAALAAAESGKFDVALVDIRMPGMDGVELARHLARLPDSPAVIFVTAYDQYAIDAFELAALDYLLKPVRARRLLAALRKAKRHDDNAQRLQASALAVRQNLSCFERGRILLVPVEDILYLKAEQKYVTAYTAGRDYLLEESLTQLEEEFKEHFLRIHRSVLVARRAVAGAERVPGGLEMEAHWQVLLKGIDAKLVVSRRLWAQVKSALNLPK